MVGPAAPATSARPRWLRPLQWGVVIVLTAATAAGSVLLYQKWFVPKLSTGTLTVETVPPNLEVVIAGKKVGRTPLTLPLAAGTYDVVVGDSDQRRTIKATVIAGGASVQHVELVPAAPTAPATGSLRVQTEPAGLVVLVDGHERGVSPMTLESLEPGEHEVSVQTDHGGVIRKSVKIQPRETVSLIVSGASAAEMAPTSGGWLVVSCPIVMQLREAGKIIGTTESDRIMLTAGEHQVEIINEPLGYRSTRKVRIAAGKTASTSVTLPNGSLSLNARPWAEVWIDGERVGETPLGNLQRPIGRHEVVFRHPQLGERQESVVITLLQPVRLGVDLGKK
jgi:PEGA domain